MKGPPTFICYLCGRAFGSASLKIHKESCKKLWIARENLKPPKERRPVPDEPDGLNTGAPLTRDQYNQISANAFVIDGLVACEFCERKFYPEKLIIHNKSCTRDHPAKKVSDGVKPRGAPTQPIVSPPINKQERNNQKGHFNNNTPNSYNNTPNSHNNTPNSHNNKPSPIQSNQQQIEPQTSPVQSSSTPHASNESNHNDNSFSKGDKSKPKPSIRELIKKEGAKVYKKEPELVLNKVQHIVEEDDDEESYNYSANNNSKNYQNSNNINYDEVDNNSYEVYEYYDDNYSNATLIDNSDNNKRNKKKVNDKKSVPVELIPVSPEIIENNILPCEVYMPDRQQIVVDSDIIFEIERKCADIQTVIQAATEELELLKALVDTLKNRNTS